jgi:hypothetical protein
MRTPSYGILGLFPVKSMYLDLMNGHKIFLRKYLWKLKIHLKIKKFMWFLHNKVLLTKDNLSKRNWNGSQNFIISGVCLQIPWVILWCNKPSFCSTVSLLIEFGSTYRNSTLRQIPCSMNFNNLLNKQRKKSKNFRRQTATRAKQLYQLSLSRAQT